MSFFPPSSNQQTDKRGRQFATFAKHLRKKKGTHKIKVKVVTM